MPDTGQVLAVDKQPYALELTLGEQAELLSAVIYQSDQYSQGLQKAADDLAVFGREQDKANAAADRGTTAFGALADSMSRIVDTVINVGLAAGRAAAVPASAPTSAPPRPVGGNITIINPPGTPATIVQSGQIYQSRNGDRTAQ